MGEGVRKGSPWEDLRGQVLFGEEGLVENLKNLLEHKREVKEIPRTQRYLGRVGLDKILSGQEGKAQRDIMLLISITGIL